MKTKAEFKNGSWTQFKQSLTLRAGVLLLCLAALVLALAGSARAETQPAAIPFPDIGAKATVDYKGDALGITATSDGARLNCGFQKLEGHATREGLWLESTEPGAAGKFRLVATTLRRDDNSTVHSQPAISLPATGTVSVEDKLVRFTRPGVTEEYSVSVDGVRQDFVIAAPPAGAGDLRVELALGGARAEAMAGGAKLQLDGSGRELVYSRLRVEDAAGRELTARLEVLSADRLAVSVADASATYPVRIDPTFSDADWDWSALGSGMSGTAPWVYSIAVSGTNLYAGGYFTTAGGVHATNIAKWNGSAWSALGSGLNGIVDSLVVSGTNLYAGGYFTKAGGITANSVAKWDGSAWSALGRGISGTVRALAVSGTNLYAGGNFQTAGIYFATNIYIAKWDGSDWSVVCSWMTKGNGGSADVRALAVSGANVYAGGEFNTVDGVPANNIAKWDGNAWSALGSGLGNAQSGVIVLAVSGTDLYAGGSFSIAGGVTANSIAKWNGSAWSALGSGMSNGVVCALAVLGTDLYAGGNFTKAGGVAAKSIARWNGSAWSGPGAGLNGTVYALPADGAGHLFVGGSFTLAGATVCPCIAAVNLSNAPTILMPPQSQTASHGHPVDFTVDVAGTPPLNLQWFVDVTNGIAGATNSELQLTNVQFSQSGSYTVVVTNLFGSATSSPAILNVIGVAPTIVTPPMGQPARVGGTVNFSVSAAGSLPLTYQWFFNDTNVIAGAGDSVLRLTPIQSSQSGTYSVIVTNMFGSVTSSPVMLTVAPVAVVTNCTEAALRASLGLGGIVTFACDGTITLGSTITNAVDTMLDGSGHQIIISGGNLVQVFQVNTNASLTLFDLTIANGRSDSGAGIFNNGGKVTATNCHFVANCAQGAPGADGSPGQNGYGGAMYNSGVFNAINSTFNQNSATGGAGGQGSYYSSYAGCDGGVGDGGAICTFGVLTLVGCTFVSNSACGGVGGVGGTPLPNDSYAKPGGKGGAGGHGYGGALFNGGSAYLVNNTFGLNSGAGAQGGDGGTGGHPGSPDYMGGNGGNGGAGGSGYSAIYNTNSQCYLTNCTLALNWTTNGVGGAGGHGGHVIDPGFPPHPGNPGYSGPNGAAGGGIRTIGGLLVNTLLSNNTPSNCSGTITDGGHNLSSDASCAFTHVGSLNNTDPKLGPLADNGGPTLTMALLPGSPAIDAGDNASAPPTDQRGVVRPYGVACDIGAYEYNLPNFPIIAIPPPTQTAEDGCVVNLTARVTGYPPPTFQWFFNGNAINGCTNSVLCLSGVQTTNIGAYTVVVSNVEGVVTSSPAMLNVIAPVERRPVPGIKLTGEAGSLLNVDYANSLSPSPNWTTLGSVSLTSTSQFCPDLTMPLPPERFYRAWQTGTPGVVPSLNLNFVPAIMLTGKVGDSLHLDCINAIGPTNDWVTLATVTLTNTSQLYFDVSALGQPARLYRIVPVP